MLFDLVPKEHRYDLFGREAELRELGNSIRSKEKLIVIYGVRRVGKTSLLHVFLNEKEVPYILIDIRDIYFEEGYISLPSICSKIINEFTDFTKNKLGIDTEGIFDSNAYESLTKTLKIINNWCKDKHLNFVISSSATFP